MKKQQKQEPQAEPSLRDKLLNYLGALGIKRLTVDYSGSGDSGQTDDISTVPDRNMILDEKFEDTDKELKQVIDEFAWEAIENNESGFYNNDGGQGRIVFDVKKRTITMEHYNNVIETVYEEYDL
jgi:hypothetical protein